MVKHRVSRCLRGRTIVSVLQIKFNENFLFLWAGQVLLLDGKDHSMLNVLQMHVCISSMKIFCFCWQEPAWAIHENTVV